MKRLIFAFLTLLLAASVLQATQNTNSSTVTRKAAVKRGPVFRATKEQIKQAQTILKGRGFYTGEESGKLDSGTRAALRCANIRKPRASKSPAR